jgi:hypothetical protein
MAKRLSVKNRKRRHDQATQYKADGGPKGFRDHKVAIERSKKALKKKSNPA